MSGHFSKRKFISDIIDINLFKSNEFNLIASGCGTGKSYFIANNLLKHYNHVKPSEVMFITSRSITVDQQSINDNIDKFDLKSKNLIKYWNGEIDDNYSTLSNIGIQIMTYDKIIKILISENNEYFQTLCKVKIVVFDECHTLFSDLFIKNIELIKVWIRDEIYKNRIIFLGLTATPDILNFYQNEWGVKVNQINKNVLINYKVKQLHCTNFNTIPYIISTNRLIGKTLIMCYSISDCFELQRKLSNAAVLVSKNSKYYSNDMDNIRKEIVDNEKLPDTFKYPVERDQNGKPIKFETRDLNVLITTSTLREGINLNEDSGIKNVICCFSDELHIIQFVGRCRFDVDNLVIAETYIRTDNQDQNSYLSQCRKSFKEYMKNKNNVKWFDSISHIIDHDCYNSKKFILGSEEEKFIEYINKKWLVPIGSNNLDQYKIYREDDKIEIINKAIECKLFILHKSLITFNKVISLLKNSLGYDIENGRITVKKQKYSYKIVLSFDEYKINYIPQIETINE